MAIPMKLLLLDPLHNEWGNGLVAINKMRGELVDFPDDWEIGISDKTGTSAMQSFIIYNNEAYDIVKNYYDMDNKVRIFMCIKSREPYDDEELWNAQKPGKKDDTTTKPDTSTPVLQQAKEALANGFAEAGLTNNAELAAMVNTDLAFVYDTGTLNYKLITPSYKDENNKLMAWRKAVADGEEAEAVTCLEYKLTQSINTVIDAGMTYQVNVNNVKTICGTRTKTVANLIKMELENYSKDATFELGGSVVEVNGKVYVGWIAKLSLPHVAKTKKDPLIDRAKANLAQAFTDAGKTNNEELSAKIAKFLEAGTDKNGTVNMNVVDPLEPMEQAKLGTWMTAVENGEHADACSITIYTLTTDLDLDTNAGPAYEVTEDTVTSLPYDKTKSFIEEQTESAASIHDDYDITFAGNIVELNGKVYIGWAVIIDLPEVAEVIPPLTERAAPKIDTGIRDAGFTNNAELASMVTTALNKIDSDGKLNLNNVTPLEEDEIVKLATWTAAVENGEHADACSIITYTIVTDLDTATNVGPAYELTEDTLESLAYTKSKSVAEENYDNATSISENATYAIGGAVAEVNGKTYIGWAIKIGLPEVAEVPKPISEQAEPFLMQAFTESGEERNTELSQMVDTVLGTVDASGNIDMNNVTPLEEEEQAKLGTWMTAVEAGEKAEACSMIIYTVTTDLNAETNVGPAYEITQDTLESLALTKTKEFIAEQKESATSIHADATFEVGAFVKEVNDKSYIGWAIKIGLPEVAATVTPGTDTGDNDVSFGDLVSGGSDNGADNDVDPNL